MKNFKCKSVKLLTKTNFCFFFCYFLWQTKIRDRSIEDNPWRMQLCDEPFSLGRPSNGTRSWNIKRRWKLALMAKGYELQVQSLSGRLMEKRKLVRGVIPIWTCETKQKNRSQRSLYHYGVLASLRFASSGTTLAAHCFLIIRTA